MENKTKTNSYRFVRPLLNIHVDDTYTYALLTFLCHAANNESGESWHSHASITYTTGMRDRAIRSAIKALVRMKLISCETRGTVAKKESKLYTVHYDRMVELESEGRAGRKEFLLSQKARKAKWQRSWRAGFRAGCESDVERTANATNLHDVGHVANSIRPGVERVGDSHVERVGASHVECVGDTQTTKYELGKKQLVKQNQLKADAFKISGSRERADVTAVDVQKLEREVSELKSLKDRAVSDRRPDEYERLKNQLLERQAELNKAHGSLFKAARAAA